MLRKISLVSLVFVLSGLIFLHMIGRGLLGRHEGPGEIRGPARPAAVELANRTAQRSATLGIGAATPKQILFGDLHVHTTFSFDAFMTSVPAGPGHGSHPPADACDFARYCSALDFWSINDHAEAITPRNWRETVDSIRACNAVAGEAADPDLVSFLGWEWTDVGTTPSDHYGHKNVVLAHTDETRIPARPIAAASTVRRTQRAMSIPAIGLGAVAFAAAQGRVHDLARYVGERRDIEVCPEDVDVRDLPSDCLETAATPADLFRKLDEWGHPSIVIPHGTTWGFYTPPGSTWDKQLAGPLHDPKRQTLLEIYSGHGDSEVHRAFRGVRFDASGTAQCPEPGPAYVPTCWRAGEIIRQRCLSAGEGQDECDARAQSARRHAAAAGNQAHLTVPGARPADWLDAGQCTDCAEPAFNYRPGGSAQYIMALGDFENPASPRRFRFGFMASSDNHYARPGTGYKEVQRQGFTESGALATDLPSAFERLLVPPNEDPVPRSRPFDPADTSLPDFAQLELERQTAFFLTGGLIAVHAEGRRRETIWNAMQRREVYATSGPRILLWFDLLNPPGTRGRPLPMGSGTRMREAPIFQVRAVGSFAQRKGCPEHAVAALGRARVADICRNECYNPSDARRPITRIEVVRIRPQQRADEPIGPLIEDPWRAFVCEPNEDGCAVTFSDPEHTQGERDALYYVRAIEALAPGINAGNLRCERDAAGACIATRPCTGSRDDCVGPHEPRAWSSPIFLDWPRSS